MSEWFFVAGSRLSPLILWPGWSMKVHCRGPWAKDANFLKRPPACVCSLVGGVIPQPLCSTRWRKSFYIRSPSRPPRMHQQVGIRLVCWDWVISGKNDWRVWDYDIEDHGDHDVRNIALSWQGCVVSDLRTEITYFMYFDDYLLVITDEYSVNTSSNSL